MAATAGQASAPTPLAPPWPESAPSLSVVAAPLTLATTYVRRALQARPGHRVLGTGYRVLSPWIPAFVEALPVGWSATRTRVWTQMCALGGSFAALMTWPHTHIHIHTYDTPTPLQFHIPPLRLIHESLFCN